MNAFTSLHFCVFVMVIATWWWPKHVAANRLMYGVQSVVFALIVQTYIKVFQFKHGRYSRGKLSLSVSVTLASSSVSVPISRLLQVECKLRYHACFKCNLWIWFIFILQNTFLLDQYICLHVPSTSSCPPGKQIWNVVKLPCHCKLNFFHCFKMPPF